MDGSIWREGEVLTEAEAERYDELAEGEVLDAEGTAELEALQTKIDGTFTAEQKKVAGVLCYVDRDGNACHEFGLVLPEHKTAAIEAGLLKPSQHNRQSDAPKGPISQALRQGLFRVAQGAKQHAVLRDPDLLIDLLAYQLSHALHWNKAPQNARSRRVWIIGHTKGSTIAQKTAICPFENESG